MLSNCRLQPRAAGIVFKGSDGELCGGAVRNDNAERRITRRVGDILLDRNTVIRQIVRHQLAIDDCAVRQDAAQLAIDDLVAAVRTFGSGVVRVVVIVRFCSFLLLLSAGLALRLAFRRSFRLRKRVSQAPGMLSLSRLYHRCVSDPLQLQSPPALLCRPCSQQRGISQSRNL